MMSHEQFLEVACGDQNAANFLAAFQDKAHLLDDVVDHDDRSEADHAKIELNWVLTLAQNPFVRQYADRIVPVLALGLNAWLDSNQMRRSTKKQDRMASDVVKGYYHEVIYLVALICGGYDHMRAMSWKFRSYDFEEVN
jgi:hypothetical protein